MGGQIRVGIGGWTYAPWRGGVFYPEGLTQKRELEYASRQMGSIEISGTFYGTQKPSSFAKWHDETPDDFVFTLKGPRYATNRRVLAESGESVERFLTSGLVELKSKLGAINWQFPHTKKFYPDDFEAFLKLLPSSIEGLPLRHAVELRHESFCVPEFVELARAHQVAIIDTTHNKYPQITENTAPFTYIRMQTSSEDEALGYSEEKLDALAQHANSLAYGAEPRDVFVFFIGGGAKSKNPAAVRALMDRLDKN